MKSELLVFDLKKSVSGAAFSFTNEQLQESPLSSFFFWEPLGQQEPEACEACFSGEKAQQQAGLAIAKARKTAMKILRLTLLRIFGWKKNSRNFYGMVDSSYYFLENPLQNHSKRVSFQGGIQTHISVKFKRLNGSLIRRSGIAPMAFCGRVLKKQSSGFEENERVPWRVMKGIAWRRSEESPVCAGRGTVGKNLRGVAGCPRREGRG